MTGVRDGRLIHGHLAVLHLNVFGEKFLRDEAFFAAQALVRSFAGVQSRVHLEHRGLAELETADSADARVVHHFGEAGGRPRAEVISAQPRLLLARRTRFALGTVFP